MAHSTHKYVKKAGLPARVRIPYTVEELIDYTYDLNRKFRFGTEEQLMESVNRSASYIKNTLNSLKQTKKLNIDRFL